MEIIKPELSSNYVPLYNLKCLYLYKRLYSTLYNNNFYTTSFVNNLNSISVYNNQLLNSKDVANYMPLFNVLNLPIKESLYEKTINHELLHVSSSMIVGNYVLSGFSQTNINTMETIGYALNEGYTYYLDEKYFHQNNHELFNRGYKIAKDVSLLINNIFGLIIDELYFKSDLYTLYNLLVLYTSKEETIVFFNNLDYIFNNIDSILKFNKVIKSYEIVYHYLIKLGINKIINEETYTEDRLNNFIKNANKRINLPLKVISSKKYSEEEINSLKNKAISRHIIYN